MSNDAVTRQMYAQLAEHLAWHAQQEHVGEGAEQGHGSAVPEPIEDRLKRLLPPGRPEVKLRGRDDPALDAYCIYLTYGPSPRDVYGIEVFASYSDLAQSDDATLRDRYILPAIASLEALAAQDAAARRAPAQAMTQGRDTHPWWAFWRKA